MNNEIQLFHNDEFGDVRTVIINGEPWFVGRDIAGILGYKDTSDALKRHVDPEDKLSRCFTNSGQKRSIYVVNESGVYSLILSSKLPSAKQFKRWVTSEILPTIRKTGRYGSDDASFLINKFFPVATEQQRVFLHTALTQIETLSAQIEENRPKVEFADQVASTDALITIGTMAKVASDKGIAMGQNRLFQFLRDMHILIDSEDKRKNLPYQEYLDRGYFKVREKAFHKRNGTYEPYFQTMVTGKGQLYIIKRLRKDYYPGMYPPELW